ncbi:fibro-slime domain-containing protein [Bermanella marisrubri]|uniref:PA14 domain-containing protein n=1 Tax=Bermanella marisrubri TaxID=207949 RepID=Q1N1J3_9GAMM|nr:fibro-slime domain-containing protein [Bermanella marisrubri]EAT12057.1 hypothetical protein RED65_03425 [Oceanobacter sp. RED65] [Bermanella marisrubri]QIZ83527.1 fibro-slime domain-containing protein [Bermanella marisrubri]
MGLPSLAFSKSMACAAALFTLLMSNGVQAIDEDYDDICRCQNPYESGRSIPVVIRDFKESHPDFESFTGNYANTNIVEEDLGPDGRPVYSGEDYLSTSGKENFDQWYRNVPGVNIAFPTQLKLTEVAPGLWEHKDMEFFPIDNLGWGNERFPRNYHFTMEMHLQFLYEGGESFTFRGDDDLWVFINGKLAINLGGTHPMLEDTIHLDDLAEELGIEPGNMYSFDLFFAERHFNHSRFMFQTTIDLECL